jgi:hypothetical protein
MEITNNPDNGRKRGCFPLGDHTPRTVSRVQGPGQGVSSILVLRQSWTRVGLSGTAAGEKESIGQKNEHQMAKRTAET